MSQSTNITTKRRAKLHTQAYQQRHVTVHGYKQKDDLKCKHSESNMCYSTKYTDRQTDTSKVQVQLQSDTLTAKGRVELQM